MFRAPRLAALSALLVGALALAGCTASETDDDRAADSVTTAPSASTEPVEMPAAPAGLEVYYDQDVAWEACGDDFECARVEVPLDYAVPDGERIELALKRLPAEDGDARIGSLLINPGGPGGSGVQLVEAADFLFSADVRERFDLVGFDPRGVNESDAVECVSDAELDEMRSTEYDVETPEGLAEFTASATELGEKCAAGTGPLLAHVDTESAARDLDILRDVVGDPQLYYFGYSYGTFLGAIYAETFPANVGRMVLDGAVDPALDSAALVMGQAVGFENAIRAYAEDCLAGDDCPLKGDVDDAVGQIQDLLATAEATPLPTGSDRELTGSLAASGIIMTLYDNEYWPLLTSALDAAMYDGDGSQLLFLADVSAEREEDGSYLTNSTEAFNAINCLDYPAEADLAQMQAQAAELAEASPTFGEMLAYGDITCDVWPYPSTAERTEVHAEGAAPILVIGTTGDPATPYEWSVSLAEQLADAVLVTYEGEGHTAYGRSNSCVTEAVDTYLIEGTLPEDGLTC
ncbi:alpha/beta hydrolase [Georgenia faecalis]|uniref:alpha/beta hydrolase n=1 Tax=Georgenia faecalis TaxID=2483799 RepID=UPI001F499FF5|nr:alpha/beta hydrolase [Georgenia faecalis]